MSVAGDCATVTVFVEVSPDDAFEIFTAEIDRWWRQGPRFRVAGRRRGTLHFECKPGGRLFETFELSTGSRTLEMGRITAWEPPSRLVFEWRAVNFKPHESTEVEVVFQPFDTGTQVTVLHRGWASLPDNHPARHGLVGPEFSRFIGMWWGSLMTSLREYAAQRGS